MKALLTNFHQSPRKVRLVADSVRGKSIVDARAILTFLPQKASPAILKLVDSAVANARNQGHSAEDLFVKTIMVDKGLVMRRYSPKARGRAGAIRKTMSIVKVELGSHSAPKPVVAEAKKTAAKKVAAKKTPAGGRKKAAKKVAKKAE